MSKRFSKLAALILSLVMLMSALPAQAAAPQIKIQLDGKELTFPDAQPCIQNNRTMVPISPLSKALGCTVKLDRTGTVTITRAGDTIQMTFGDKTAYLNGQPIQMDVAPYVYQNRTMIPAAYVSKFFGQTIKMHKDLTVTIDEDKSQAGESNLENWALPMGSMLSQLNGTLTSEGPRRFGIYRRTSSRVERCRNTLSESWGINSREDLIDTVARMTFSGHNTSFLADAALVNSLSDTQYQKLLAEAEGVDAYMWPYTKQLSEKWGDRGILCWDLFRMSNLVQWGYVSGYVTYPEALALLEPAATLLAENFSSWEEAYENYLDGYVWWSREDISDCEDIWHSSRGYHYQVIKNMHGHLFDDSLFQTGVIPVPGLSMEDIMK